MVVLQHVRAFLEQAHSVHQQVVKIHGVPVLQPPLVQPVGPGHLFAPEVVPRALGVLLRGDELILSPGDLPQHRPGRQGTLGDLQFL